MTKGWEKEHGKQTGGWTGVVWGPLTAEFAWNGLEATTPDCVLGSIGGAPYVQAETIQDYPRLGSGLPYGSRIKETGPVGNKGAFADSPNARHLLCVDNVDTRVCRYAGVPGVACLAAPATREHERIGRGKEEGKVNNRERKTSGGVVGGTSGRAVCSALGRVAPEEMPAAQGGLYTSEITTLSTYTCSRF